MKQQITLKIDSEFVRPLSKAQNEFIQVLLSSFTIFQGDKGLILEVEFDNESLAIWLREGKSYIQKQLDPSSAKRYQNELESILIGQETKRLIFNDPGFPFRFGNGGTLPVIRYGDMDYYCFFYRDIPPVGWNIANGGAESISELLDPLATIERELREELIIVDDIIDPSGGSAEKCLYVFDWSEGRRSNHPDFAIARRVWEEIFNRRDFKQLNDRTLPLKWLSGRDSVVIKFGEKDKIEISDCFLNINAEDFGIEIDRVAKLAVSNNAILCDGELSNGKLLNQIVGLFEVHRFNAAMAAGKKEYYPDFAFWNGQKRRDVDFEQVVKDYLDYVINQGIRPLESLKDWKDFPFKYGLCPVTRNLIRRYLHMQNEVQHSPDDINPPSQTDIFLSFASEDLELAKKVYCFLRNSGYSVFFSDETLNQANFADEVDDALKAARSMVLVGSETDRFFKPWVRYEWQSFHNDILAKRKPWETPLVTFTTAPDLNSLPRPLVHRQIIDYKKGTFDESLMKLERMLTTISFRY